jgi:cell shape-determining protein MreC
MPSLLPLLTTIQRNGIRGIGKGIASNQEKLMVRFIDSGLDIKVGDVFLTSTLIISVSRVILAKNI